MQVETGPDGYRLRSQECRVCLVKKEGDEFRTFSARRKFRGTCKDCQNEQERKRRLAKPGRTADQRKSWRLNNRGSALVSAARCRARDRGLGFDLNAVEIQRVIDAGACQLTGLPFDLNDTECSPSLDRKDPAKGYTKNNVRVVLSMVNVMLNRWGHEKILLVADAIRARGL